jgi:hypothetical protein
MDTSGFIRVLFRFLCGLSGNGQPVIILLFGFLKEHARKTLLMICPVTRSFIALQKKHRVDRGVNDIHVKYPFAQGVYLISGIIKTQEPEKITPAG